MTSPLSISELVLEVLYALEDRCDILNASLVSKTFNGACAVRLYETVNIDELSVGLLEWTLQQKPGLGRLIKHLDIGRNDALLFPRDPATAGRPVRLLAPFLTNLGTFIVDMADVDDLPSTGLFASLCSLPSSQLNTLSILASAASMTLKDLYPVLKKYETTLRHLSISGVSIDGDVFLPAEPLKLSVLESLYTDWFEVTDDQMSALFGHCRQLKSFEIGLDVTESPSSAEALKLVKQNGETLEKLCVRQPWIGSDGGEPSFGLDMAKACQPGTLKDLSLDGQIFDRQLFELPATNALEKLELHWCDIITFEDLEGWLLQGKAKRLKRLNATAKNYLNELDDIDMLGRVTDLCERKSIKVEVGCSYNVFVPFFKDLSGKFTSGPQADLRMQLATPSCSLL